MLHRLRHDSELPGFTSFCLELMPFWYVPPILAGVYCGIICFRKMGISRSWFGFFATTTAILVLLGFPILIAAGLPVIDLLNVGLAQR